MENSSTYFDRAWRDLKSDEGWWKAIFAFGMVNCIPVIGQIILFGYLFDWAKEAAWGMDLPLSRQIGDIGRRIKYGFMSLWVVILWEAPVLLIAFGLSFIPYAGGPLTFFMELFAIMVYPLAAVGALRSLVYEHVRPGVQVKHVLKMANHDPMGLMQCFCVFLLIIPLLFAALFVALLPTIPFINLIATTTISSALGADLVRFVLLGMLTIVVALMIWVACGVVSALIVAVFLRSLGLWFAQFKPAEWRSPTSPMAFEIEDKEKKEKEKQTRKEAKIKEKAAIKEARLAKKQAKKAKKSGDLEGAAKAEAEEAKAEAAAEAVIEEAREEESED